MFVVYSPKSYLLYERYFDLLEQLGYEIVVISNGGLPQEFIDIFKDRVIGMGERNNIGRDFGTYKEFILSLKIKILIWKIWLFVTIQSLQILEKMIIDSQNLSMLIARKIFLELQNIWETQIPCAIIYFLMFSENVLKGKNFSNFWTNF